MSMQQRWYCLECQREWVFARQGSDHCPACGSGAVQRVSYSAAFPGGDVDREARVLPAPPPPVEVGWNANPVLRLVAQDASRVMGAAEALTLGGDDIDWV